MENTLKTLIATLTLSSLMAASLFVESASAERLDPAREQAIGECMALQNRDPHDGYEGKRGGGLQWHYLACMAEHGQRQ
jgi:hypothetical protein